MARRRGVDSQTTVTRGFVTEFSATAFPREAAIDLDNVIIDPDATVRRRGGLDLEQQFTLNSVDGSSIPVEGIGTMAFTTHLWKGVNNSGTLNIVVQQLGVELQFYAQFGALSANLLGTYDMSPHAINSPAALRTSKVAAASGLGDLYVVSPEMEPIRLTLSSDGTSFSAEEIAIEIRDLEGIEDGLLTDERPASLDRAHYYNLRNQGWTDENIGSFAGVLASSIPAQSGDVGGMKAAVGKDFPSNADIMTTGIVTNSDGNLEFDGEFIRNDYFGNTSAPKGHFILSAFNKDYSEALGVAVGTAFFGARPEAVTFFQGRSFFTAPTVQNRIGGVYYSQQLIQKEFVNRCYQAADPTASEINDLIDTDGGYLPMPEVGQILKLTTIAKGIIVYATNTVKYITGADGAGLTATNIRLDKISDIGALGAGSIVDTATDQFYWGVSGIMQIVVGTETGEPQIQNISKRTIQTHYINISGESRRNAVGVYMPEQDKIYWGYRDALARTQPTQISMNRFLILDLSIRGFYKYSIGESQATSFPEIIGLTLVPALASTTVDTPVLELDGSNVTELDGSLVTTQGVTNIGQVTALKVATLVFSTLAGGYKFTFSTFHSRSFHDWFDFDPVGVGINYSSFIDYAEFQMDGIHTQGTVSYVHSFFQRTSKNLEPNGYWELPPLYYKSTGMRLSQSVIEVLNKPSSNMRLSQSVIEAVGTVPSDLILTRIGVETLFTPA